MAIYDTILFDLDGTLTDPKIGITKSVQYALSKFGIIVENPDTLTPFIGPPLKDSFIEFYSFSERKAYEAIEMYREYYSVTGKYENIVYPGIMDLLSCLKDQGRRLVVATSKPTVFSEDILKHFNLYSYFDFVAGSELDGTRTAKDEVIRYALSLLESHDTSKTVMVGDRKYDVLGAKSAGIDSVAVAYGYGSNEELMDTQPSFLAYTVDDLKNILCL